MEDLGSRYFMQVFGPPVVVEFLLQIVPLPLMCDLCQVSMVVCTLSSGILETVVIIGTIEFCKGM